MSLTSNILAIDASTGPCSVAVWKDGRIAACLEHSGPSMQSAVLFPLIEKAMKQANIAYRDLAAVAATVGPGSFTGIRVGLAAARGVAFAANIPSLGFTTLEVLAFAAREKTKSPALAILNAGKGEWYYQGFNDSPLFEPRVGAPELALQSVADGFVIGNFPQSNIVTPPRADALAALAALHIGEQRPLTPFYIRAPDAKLPAKKA